MLNIFAHLSSAAAANLFGLQAQIPDQARQTMTLLLYSYTFKRLKNA